MHIDSLREVLRSLNLELPEWDAVSARVLAKLTQARVESTEQSLVAHQTRVESTEQSLVQALPADIAARAGRYENYSRPMLMTAVVQKDEIIGQLQRANKSLAQRMRRSLDLR